MRRLRCVLVLRALTWYASVILELLPQHAPLVDPVALAPPPLKFAMCFHWLEECVNHFFAAPAKHHALECNRVFSRVHCRKF